MLKTIEDIKDLQKKILDPVAGLEPLEKEKDELSIGKEVEKEHSDTIKQIIEDAKNKKLKPLSHYTAMVAKDHIKEISDYYTHLSNMEKEAKKSISSRWDDLQKKLDNGTAIMDMSGDDDEEDAQQEQPQDQEQNQDNEQDDQQDVPEESDDEEKKELIANMLKAHGYSDAEIAHIIHGHSAPQIDPVDQSKVDMNNAAVQSDSELANIEKDARGKEIEIDHGHKQRVNDLEFEDLKEQKTITKMKNDHTKRMLDLEYEHAKKQKEAELKSKYGNNDSELEDDLKRVEIEHKKKMMSLELQYEKELKELDVYKKRKEMETKLSIMKEQAKANAARKEEIASVQHEEPKNNLELEEKVINKKNLKKNDELLIKYDIGDWKYNDKTKQYSHAEHGSIAMRQSNSGHYEVVHNGKIIGSSPHASTAHTHMINRMMNPLGIKHFKKSIYSNISDDELNDVDSPYYPIRDFINQKKSELKSKKDLSTAIQQQSDVSEGKDKVVLSPSSKKKKEAEEGANNFHKLDLRPQDPIDDKNIESYNNPDHKIGVSFHSHDEKNISEPIKSIINEPSGKSTVTFHNSMNDAKTHAFNHVKRLMGIE